MATAATQRTGETRQALGGSGAGRGAPERRCIATGESHAKERLIRFVVGPDGALVPDLAGKLPGRGLWIIPQRDILERACKRNLFAKAARAPVVVPGDLVALVEAAVTRRCLDILGLAKRAGELVAGFEKVKAKLAGGKTGVLLQAADAAADGRDKLRALARAGTQDVALVDCFTADQLGQALGQGIWVHVAMAPGRLAQRLISEAARLTALRGGDGMELNAKKVGAGKR